MLIQSSREHAPPLHQHHSYKPKSFLSSSSLLPPVQGELFLPFTQDQLLRQYAYVILLRLDTLRLSDGVVLTPRFRKNSPSYITFTPPGCYLCQDKGTNNHHKGASSNNMDKCSTGCDAFSRVNRPTTRNFPQGNKRATTGLKGNSPRIISNYYGHIS